MTTRNAMFLSVFLATAARVFAANANPATRPTTAPATPASQPTLDQQVIEAALLDLLSASDDDSATLRNEQGNNRLTFTIRARDWVGTLRQELQSAEADSWRFLPAPH